MPLDDLENLKANIREQKFQVELWTRHAERCSPGSNQSKQAIKLKQHFEAGRDDLLRVLHKAEAAEQSKQSTTASRPSKTTLARSYKSSPEVTARRVIVLGNPGLHSQQYCPLFDEQRLGLPERWENKFGVTTWVDAYTNEKARGLIHKMICTYKKQT